MTTAVNDVPADSIIDPGEALLPEIVLDKLSGRAIQYLALTPCGSHVDKTDPIIGAIPIQHGDELRKEGLAGAMKFDAIPDGIALTWCRKNQRHVPRLSDFYTIGSGLTPPADRPEDANLEVITRMFSTLHLTLPRQNGVS